MFYAIKLDTNSCDRIRFNVPSHLNLSNAFIVSIYHILHKNEKLFMWCIDNANKDFTLTTDYLYYNNNTAYFTLYEEDDIKFNERPKLIITRNRYIKDEEFTKLPLEIEITGKLTLF